MDVRELIKKHEGLRLKPYQDSVGVWTVGHGHNLEATGESIPEVITLTRAEEYFESDMRHAISGCYELDVNFKDLDEVRQAVLVDMCFNLGKFRLIKFVNTLKFIRDRDYSSAASNMLKSKWAKQVGKRAVTLSNMMLTGKWQS
jgi:lysozyme